MNDTSKPFKHGIELWEYAGVFYHGPDAEAQANAALAAATSAGSDDADKPESVVV
jgi:hypothetical protein